MRDNFGLGISIAILVALCVLASWVGEFWTGVLARCVTWMFLAISFTIAYSFANVPSVAQATVFGAGAFTAIWIAPLVHGDIVLLLVASIFAGAIISLILAFLVLRMSHSGAAIGTIIVAIAFSMLGNAAVGLTGGTDGLPLPTLSFHFFGLPLAAGPNFGMLLLGTGFLSALLLGFWYVSGTGRWRTVRAIQQNALRAQMLGYNAAAYRIMVYTISGAVAGLGGGLYALVSRHVAIDSISLAMSLKSILWAAVGGITSIYGGPIGVLLIQLTSEILLRWTVRVDLIIGVFLIVVALWLPQGAMGLKQRYFKMKR
ncbi:branched-chain amino acid ABC transporter permease [Rhizobium sp. KVB221]|uniref:Branched-chain amino acid ABC transporter permease n=1 Tax=Rhizobium setariae TaxID=2801340 RepID=A0A936YRJ5_9HYPH|nr:branched-chain amino acid ABC transporter permease [Rhizobium setariae]MBL0374343.1 branched-chain amino acid ABC transporter permease [Rhizobium setariae]